jgi:hypothetical protein
MPIQLMMALHRWEAEWGSTKISLMRTISRQQLVNEFERAVGDLRQHITQPDFEIDPVQLGCADQRVDGGRTFTIPVSTREKVIAPAYGDATKCPVDPR